MSRTMTGESAYLRGREAFRRGLPVVDNPTFRVRARPVVPRAIGRRRGGREGARDGR